MWTDKSIVLVGNGFSLLHQELGELIDSFDVVVRMNHGYPRPDVYQHTGRRTDVWMCHFNAHRRQPERYRQFGEPRWIIRLNNRTHVNIKLRSKMMHWDMSNYDRLRKQYLQDRAHLSCGFTAAYFFAEYLELKNVNLVGYDFFRYNNFYEGKQTANVVAPRYHDSSVEESYLTGLAEAGKIRFLNADLKES